MSGCPPPLPTQSASVTLSGCYFVEISCTCYCQYVIVIDALAAVLKLLLHRVCVCVYVERSAMLIDSGRACFYFCC